MEDLGLLYDNINGMIFLECYIAFFFTMYSEVFFWESIVKLVKIDIFWVHTLFYLLAHALVNNELYNFLSLILI